MQCIQPIGKKAAEDRQGNPIYQVPANEVEIGYKLIGSGEPLLMIMGIANTMERWPNTFVDALSEHYQLILMDNRGMGYTTANDEEFTTKLFAEDVMALLDALKRDKVHLLGASMGGVIAQELLLRYPNRFHKVVLYATTTDGSELAKTVKDRLPNHLIAKRQFAASSAWKSPLDKLSQVTNPVMIVVGTADTVVGVESSKTLATTIPGAWLIQFKNGTHILMNEAPEEFSKAIINFLELNQSIEVRK
jgi:pimeloyl-ACP methyl ester carboxylesterase